MDLGLYLIDLGSGGNSLGSRWFRVDGGKTRMPSLVDHVLGFGLFWIDKLLTTGKAHLLKLECFLVVLLLKVSRHHLIRRVLPLNHFTSREMLVRNPWLLNWGVHQHLILHISGLLCFSWYYER